MKTVLLLALSTIATAVEEAPSFNDLRVVLGVPPPVTKATAQGVDYETDQAFGPHVAAQWVHGSSGATLGAALGVELSMDDFRGEVTRTIGTSPDYGSGTTYLRAVSLALVPKFVLRPDYQDPFDWPLGSFQLEFGPMLGVGTGVARIGGSPQSDKTTVLRWGARLDLVWTVDSRWQCGLSMAWEAFEASPDVYGDASISGDGLCGGLIIGRRL